jgi:hypothetical protein
MLALLLKILGSLSLYGEVLESSAVIRYGRTLKSTDKMLMVVDKIVIQGIEWNSVLEGRYA